MISFTGKIVKKLRDYREGNVETEITKETWGRGQSQTHGGVRSMAAGAKRQIRERASVVETRRQVSERGKSALPGTRGSRWKREMTGDRGRSEEEAEDENRARHRGSSDSVVVVAGYHVPVTAANGCWIYPTLTNRSDRPPPLGDTPFRWKPADDQRTRRRRRPRRREACNTIGGEAEQPKGIR